MALFTLFAATVVATYPATGGIGEHCYIWRIGAIYHLHHALVVTPRKNACHQPRSALNSAERWIQWFNLFAFVAKSIILCKNRWSALTTMHACASLPMRESSSLFIHARWPDHCSSMLWSSSTFSSGSLISIFVESKRIPRNVIMQVGPSIFSFNGRPSFMQVSLMTYSWDWHMLD